MFGGAFDPPHLAHRALLEDAVSGLGLDAVHVVPTGQAWHKPQVLTSPEHRLAMAQLAFAGVPQVVVDRLEIDRCGPSYTIDTLHHIAAAEPGAELFLMMGADQAAALMTWRAWQEILQIAIICVADRAHHSSVSALFDAEKLFPERFLHLTLPAMHLSATQIRHGVATGQSVQTLVSEPVARYIADHHLYQSN
jgi:nicotinate-nucleotide adenylyltransferase